MPEENKTVRWSKTAVTNAGTSLLTEFAAGRILDITGAYGSISDPGDNLIELEELPDGRTHPLSIESVTRTDDSVTVCVQVTSLGNDEPYKLERIGITAVTRDPGEPKEPEGVPIRNDKLLMVIEDTEDEKGSKGVTIPAETDQLYTFKLYAVLTITNKERLEVSVSAAGIATIGAIHDAIDEHSKDPKAHLNLTARVNAVEAMLNGGSTIIGDQPPDVTTEGVKGQHYIDRDGTDFVCTGVTENGYIWEPWANVNPSVFATQTKLMGLHGQVVGFDATGAAAAVQGWSNVNRLDNWYFADAINQRGGTGYTNAGYCIDRWIVSGAITIESDGIVLSSTTDRGQLAQYIENPNDLFGKTWTISAYVDAELYTYTASIPQNPSYPMDFTSASTNKIRLYLYRVSKSDLFNAGLWISAGSEPVKLKAVKLELGSQQTLAHQDADGNWVLNDPPPNKALELLKCQRYLRPLKYSEVRASRVTASAVRAWFPGEVAMRANPTLVSGSFQVKTLSSETIMNDAAWSYEVQGNGIVATATLPSHSEQDVTIYSNDAVLSSEL